MQEAAASYEFGQFVLDQNRRALLADGEPVALSSRAFDILAVLLEERDRVVGRDELVSRVWGGIAVGQNNLAVQMSALRAALAGLPGGDRLILTIPGRGYRFVGDAVVRDRQGRSASEAPPVAATPAAATQSSTRRNIPSWWLAGLAMLVLALALVWRGAGTSRPDAPRFSIAVLPFRTQEPDATLAKVAGAVTDDLTTELSHIPGSVVIARESADMFRDQSVGAQAVGRALNVRYLVEGSLRLDGAMLHVESQLIDAKSAIQLWPEQFDVPREPIGEAQQMIERRIADALDVTLSEVESAESQRDRPDDPNALDLFLQAKAILDRDDGLAGHQKAQKLLERATVLQPAFPEAWAELGWTLLDKVSAFDDPDDGADFVRSSEAANRAVSLAPRSALALATQARFYAVDGRCAEAIYSAKAALAMDANSIRALSTLAKCAFELAQLDTAYQSLQSIIRLDPSGAGTKLRLVSLGYIVLLQGRPEEAIDLLHRSMAGDPDPQPGADNLGRAEIARLLLIAALELDGRHPEAIEAYRLYDRNWPHRSTWRLAGYNTKATVALPGHRRILEALQAAGMPQFATPQHARPSHTEPEASAGPSASGDFAATADDLPGVNIVDVAAFLALRKQRPAPILIDVSRQTFVPVGVACRNVAESHLSDVDLAMHAIPSGVSAREAAIVVIPDGWYGIRGFDLASKLVASGVGRVYWFKGGEEAMVAAGGQQGTDCRPQ